MTPVSNFPLPGLSARRRWGPKREAVYAPGRGPSASTFVTICRFQKKPAISRGSDPKRLYFCTVIGRPGVIRSADRPASTVQCRPDRTLGGSIEPSLGVALRTASRGGSSHTDAANQVSGAQRRKPSGTSAADQEDQEREEENGARKPPCAQESWSANQKPSGSRTRENSAPFASRAR